MSGKRMTIGRSTDCDWTVDDEYASLVHASIEERADGSLWLSDEGTLNGTWLNEVRVYAPMRLYAGDKVKVGRTVLTIP